MARKYLMYISYLGTNYKGMQRLVARQGNSTDAATIQGVLEFAVEKILGVKQASIGICSRTDHGVHAIESAVTFEHQEEEGLSPEKFCNGLNTFLERNQTEIRIRRVVEVPTDFYIRSAASSRTYLYRIAVPRHDYNVSCLNPMYVTSAVPVVTELNRIQVVLPPFDPNLVQSAIKIFLGTWNFKSFSKPGEDRFRVRKEEDYFKTVTRISFTRVNNFIPLSYYIDSLAKETDFYDFHVEGSGFLRRQVRRMVGALLGIGAQKIKEADIRYMLENPGPNSWNPKCSTAGPEGLYLKSVNFNSVPVLRGVLF